MEGSQNHGLVFLGSLKTSGAVLRFQRHHDDKIVHSFGANGAFVQIQEGQINEEV